MSLLPRNAVLFALLLTLHAPSILAEVVVVTNMLNSVEQASKDDVTNIFMGHYRKFPDGSTARPLDLDANSPIRRSFYRQLVDKSPEEINAYWARLVFSGRTTPPTETKGRDDLLEKVANDPRAIGYINRAYLERSALARNVKILLALPD